MEKYQDTRVQEWKMIRILEFRNGKGLGYQNLEMEKVLGYQNLEMKNDQDTRIQE